MRGAFLAPPGSSTCLGQWLGEVSLDQAEIKEITSVAQGLEPKALDQVRLALRTKALPQDTERRAREFQRAHHTLLMHFLLFILQQDPGVHNWHLCCGHRQDLLTGVLPHHVSAATAACLAVKYVQPRIMACLQPGGATVMEFVRIPLLLLLIAGSDKWQRGPKETKAWSFNSSLGPSGSPLCLGELERG